MSIRKSDDLVNETNSRYNNLKDVRKREKITERIDDTSHNDNPYDETLQYLNRKLDDVIDQLNTNSGKVGSDGVDLAAEATTLQNARTIGGVSFDGSANINLPGVNTAGNQNTSGTATNATNVTVTADTANANHPITFIDDTSPDGSVEGLKAASTITVNPSTGELVLGLLSITFTQGDGRTTFGTVTFTAADESGTRRTATINLT